MRRKIVWIDVSVPIREGMALWPGDPRVRMKRVSDVERGDTYTVTDISFGSHTGTHVDAPRHVLATGMTADMMPMSVAMGRARVIEVKDKESIKPEELAPHGIRQSERILFKTANSARKREEQFTQDYVYLSKEASDLLVRAGVVLVGIDGPSLEKFAGDEAYAHKALLGAGIWVVEGLNLKEVKTGSYHMACLPLKLAFSDGAPARVVLREFNQG
jgi:arylformamidase